MDQINDQNPVALYRIDQLSGTPEFVLASPVLCREDVEKFASSAFADAARREFPVFNEAVTWASYAYLKGSGRSDAFVEAGIRKAAAAFGISAELDKIDQATTGVKSASTSEVPHALPKGSIPEFPEVEVYPIKLASQIEDSARQLLGDREKMPLELFYQAAGAIVKAASSHKDLLIPDGIVAAGTLRYPDYEHATKVAAQRAYVVKDLDALMKYADAVKTAAARDDLDASAAIAAWLILDKQHGVKYARGILDPVAAFYAGPDLEEVEKAARAHVFIKDVAVPLAVVASLSSEDVDAHFSKTAATSVHSVIAKAASADGVAASLAVEALPESSKKELLRLALAVG